MKKTRLAQSLQQSAVLLAMSPLALAQQAALEEIIVTATKTGETMLQSTPIAITAFTGESLAERGVGNVRGLVDLTPGLQISDSNGYAQMYLRGVGSNNVYIGSDPSTTIHLDNVYLARPVAYFSEFLDVERVEVLRGPQGTLYGRNSVGGTINIISRRPTETVSGKVRASVGNYQQASLEGYVSGPLGDSGVLGSLSLGRWTRDGYIKNVLDGGRDLEDQDSLAVRAQILIPVGERGELTLRADYQESDDIKGGSSKLLEPVGLPLEDSILGDTWRVVTDSPNRMKVESSGIAADFGYDISETLSFRSLTAYRELESADRTDSDATSLDVIRAVFDLDQNQFSQEFTLNYSNDQLRLVTGLYYFKEEDEEPAVVILPLFGVTHFQFPDLEAESVAAYFQGDYRLNEAWSVIAGARYTREEKDYTLDDFWTFSGSPDISQSIQAPPLVGIPGFSDPFFVDSNKTASAWTPKVGLNYEPRDDLMFYVSATRGFKSGGFDFGSTTPEDQSRGYGPEYLWSYELGMKSQWLQDRLRLNMSAFLYDYEDLQVTLFTPPASATTQNAATAEVKGVELEMLLRPVAELELFANAAYLDARYDSYPEAQNKAFGIFDASGKHLNNAPEWSVSAGGTYRYALGDNGTLYVGLDAHYQSTQYYTPVNAGVGGVRDYPSRQGDYALWHGRVGWLSSDELWQVAVVGTNLADEEYITASADFGGPALESVVGRPGLRRMISLQVSKAF